LRYEISEFLNLIQTKKINHQKVSIKELKFFAKVMQIFLDEKMTKKIK